MVHFRHGDYDQAISAFQRSFDLLPSPALLFNLGQAYRRKGDCVAAAAMYRRFEASDPGAAERSNVRIRIDEMDACATPRQGVMAVTPAATLPASAPPVAISTTPRQVGGDASPMVDVPRDRGSVAATDGFGRRLRIGGIALVAFGLAASAAAVYASTQVIEERERVSELFRSGGTWDASWDGVVARGQRYEAFSKGLYAGAALTVGAGIVLYYLGHRQHEQRLLAGRSPWLGGIAW